MSERCAHYMAEYSSADLLPLLQTWQQNGDCTLLAMVAESSKAAIVDLQARCRELNLPLIGGMFPGLIIDGELKQQGLLLFRLPGHVPYVLTDQIIDKASIDAMAESLKEQLQSGESRTLFLLVDAMVGHTASILEQLYLNLADSVDYAGSSVGSETFQPMPCLFDQQHWIGNGLLAALLPNHGKTFLSHGYPTPEKDIFVTAASGNCIASIDWQPAFEAYQQMAKEQYQVDITPENFYQHAVHMPFGILQASGDVVVRMPVATTEDGSIFCIGEVPENSLLVLLDGPQAALLEAADQLGQKVAGLEASHGILFYCAGRRMHLGDSAMQAELAAFASHGTSATGALSLGEIGILYNHWNPTFHNATLVYCPLSA